IDDPKLILDFEDWMTTKKISGQTKNQYRSVMSQMYALAQQPAYRKRTGVTMNPFAGIPRDRGGQRTSTVHVDELKRWLSFASHHARVALSIAALAPKLRLANILALEWKRHIDIRHRLIVVHAHKTAGDTGKPLVVPIDEQLWAILEDTRRRNPKSKFVVSYGGRRVKTIRGAVQRAAEAAGLTWGRFKDDGVTFHTMRHTMATVLAELSDVDGLPALSESQRKTAMGHKRLETTQHYTHIRPTVERRVLERLSKATPIVDEVTQAIRAPLRRRRGKNTGTTLPNRENHNNLPSKEAGRSPRRSV
ncbi:MAG TPA: tyrosine-type recombinase/integrase, partial [Vicinamibacterales bacterium]|nr:tyrosine-type recombinase/integrase [Vicinamibacterales bacterium]